MINNKFTSEAPHATGNKLVLGASPVTDTLRTLIPSERSECAIYLKKAPNQPCLEGESLKTVLTTHHASTLEAAKIQTGCDSERCVVEAAAEKNAAVSPILSTYFKVEGPIDNTLLNNYNIDETLQQWAPVFKGFYPYNFNMLDYATYSLRHGRVVSSPDTLATVGFDQLYEKGYRCCGCVINSDRYHGKGKHWMALFADARGLQKDESGKPLWTVEFFNSSGNPPAPEWVNWMVKTKSYMEDIISARGLNATVRVTKSNVRHQRSKSECGLYSIFYIWARLNGVPPEFFNNLPIEDKNMFEFRQHLFNDPAHKNLEMRKFDFGKYSAAVNIRWEKGNFNGEPGVSE